MSRLTIYRDDAPDAVVLQTENQSEIAAKLKEFGVAFEQWEAAFPVTPESTAADILDAYAGQIDRLKSEGGYQTADVINMSPNHADKVALRQKFLSEHQHSEDEVRFFVKGSGMFYLHLEQQVLAVQCCKSDLISVPANAKHWFDMGTEPDFTCVRLFTNPEGWVANYTGDKLADSFPKFSDLAVGVSA
jgi:1,2-dihydroxy-3-keto-5-methylthiopentene dioxygenase